MASVSPEDIAYSCALGPKQRKLVSELVDGDWVAIRPHFFPGSYGSPSRVYGQVGLPNSSAWSLLKRLKKNGFVVQREWSNVTHTSGRVRISFEELPQTGVQGSPDLVQ